MDSWRFSQTVQSFDLDEDSDQASMNGDNHLQLAEIKRFFQSRSYKKCATICEATLDDVNQSQHPLYKSYLNFYAALSYDSLGRGLPLLAPARPTYLALAEKHYLAAEKYLPAPVFTQTIIESKHARTTSSRISWRAHSHRSSVESIYSTHSHSTTATSIILGLEHHFETESVTSSYDGDRPNSYAHQSKWPPRHSSRSSKTISTDASGYSLSAALEPFAELLGPLSAEMAQYEAADPSFGDEDPESDYGDDDDEYYDDLEYYVDDSPAASQISATSQRIQGYNDNLVGFRDMIQSHLSSIQRLRQTRHEEAPKVPSLPARYSLANDSIQRPSQVLPEKGWTRPQDTVSSKLADAGVSADEKRLLRQERMKTWAEQKQMGIKRFNAERYQELARAALAEL